MLYYAVSFTICGAEIGAYFYDSIFTHMSIVKIAESEMWYLL
jgi:hypothetical protein